MLAPSQGYDLLEGGKVAGQAVLDDYRLHRYHQPSDKWNPNWDLSGPISDLDAFYELGEVLANSDVWPNWYPGNEFKATRDKSMRERR
jgi:Zn-dependent M28 family amino/carboxypeptidase